MEGREGFVGEESEGGKGRSCEEGSEGVKGNEGVKGRESPVRREVKDEILVRKQRVGGIPSSHLLLPCEEVNKRDGRRRETC